MKKNQLYLQKEAFFLSDRRITTNKYSDSTSDCMCMCM